MMARVLLSVLKRRAEATLGEARDRAAAAIVRYLVLSLCLVIGLGIGLGFGLAALYTVLADAYSPLAALVALCLAGFLIALVALLVMASGRRRTSPADAGPTGRSSQSGLEEEILAEQARTEREPGKASGNTVFGVPGRQLVLSGLALGFLLAHVSGKRE